MVYPHCTYHVMNVPRPIFHLVIDTTMSLWLGLVETALLQVVQDPKQYVIITTTKFEAAHNLQLAKSMLDTVTL